MRLDQFTDAINEVTELWNAGEHAEARRIARSEFDAIKRCCDRSSRTASECTASWRPFVTATSASWTFTTCAETRAV